MLGLIDQMRAALAEKALLPSGANLVVGISGGVDSMSLLEVLSVLREEFLWTVVVAHFNHRLRGAESDLDASFVESESAARGMVFCGGAGDVRKMAATSGMSVEMAARQMRHRFLAETARQHHANKIVLAHHADDQAELFWMRVLRGVTGSGLTGMRMRGPSPADAGVELIRPFLEIPKAELVRFAHENKVAHREDVSNEDPAHLRNRLRRQALPALQACATVPLARMTIRFMSMLAEQQDYLRQEADRWRGTGESDFEALHPALQRQILHDSIIQVGLKPTADLLELLRLHPETPVCVKDNLSVRRTRDGRLVCKKSHDGGFKENLASATMDLDSTPFPVDFGGLVILAEKMLAGPIVLSGNPAWLDSGRLPRQLTLRHWQAGDTFHKMGMTAPSKLQDIFVNAKIPAGLRRKLVVAAEPSGQIVWVESIGVAMPFKVSPETTEFLRWEWRRANPDPVEV